MLRKEFTDMMNDIDEAQSIITHVDDLLTRLKANYLLSKSEPEVDLNESTYENQNQIYKKIPVAHRLDEYALPKIDGLNSEQLKELIMARNKLRNAAEVALRHLKFILEHKDNPSNAAMSEDSTRLSTERAAFNLFANEKNAIAAAKVVVKEAAVDRNKLFETFQQTVVQKIQEARTTTDENLKKLNAKEITLEAALAKLNAIQDSGQQTAEIVYGEHIGLAKREDIDKCLKELTDEVNQYITKTTGEAKKLDTALLKEFNKELQPIYEKAMDIPAQLKAGKITAKAALELLDEALLEAEDKYENFSKVQKPVTNLIEAFQVGINKIRDEVSSTAVKQILIDATAKTNAFHEKVKEARKTAVSAAAANADPIAKFEAIANSFKELIPHYVEFNENIKKAVDESALLGVEDPTRVATMEGGAYLDAKASLEKTSSENKMILEFTQLYRDIKLTVETINSVNLYPGKTTLIELDKALAKIKDDLNKLQIKTDRLKSDISSSPESELIKELKSSLDAITGALTETTVNFTKLDDLASSQRKLITVANSILEAITNDAARLESIKDNEAELTRMSAQLVGYSVELANQMQDFLRNHHDKGAKLEDFLNSPKVSKETNETYTSAINAIEAHKKEINTKLEILRKNKPVSLIDSITEATKNISSIKLTDFTSAKEAESLLKAIHTELKKEFDAKTSEHAAAEDATNDYNAAKTELMKKITAIYKKHAIQTLTTARAQLKTYTLSHYRKSEDRDEALVRLNASNNALLIALNEVPLTTLADADVTREKTAFIQEYKELFGQLEDMTFKELPKKDSTDVAFLNAMKDYIIDQHKDIKVDDLTELNARLSQLGENRKYFDTTLGKDIKLLTTAEEKTALKALQNEFAKIETKLRENIARLTPRPVRTPIGATTRPPVAHTPGSKEAVAESRARLARAEELYSLTYSTYSNAEKNPTLRAKLYQGDAKLGVLSFNDVELRKIAYEKAKAELDAQIAIQKGNDKIDIGPLKKAADDANDAAEKAEKARRDFSTAKAVAKGTAGGVTAEEQFDLFRKQMHPLYIDRCIKALTDLKQKAQLLTESAYNEEYVTKIELQAQQIRKDLDDYDALLTNISNDRAKSIYTKDLNWPDIKKISEDRKKLAEAKPARSFTEIEEKVNEARTNHQTNKPQQYAQFSVAEGLHFINPGVKEEKQIQNEVADWIKETTVKPGTGFQFSGEPDHTGEFHTRLTKCQIEITPKPYDRLFNKDLDHMKYAVVEDFAKDKSYYKATFYAKDITLLARVPDIKRWNMIYESYMRGLATGVKPDLRIPTFPKSLHSLEIDFKAIAVAYGLLDIDSFFGKERSEVEKRVKKIESAAAAKNPEIPPTTKSASAMDAAINSNSATTTLVPRRVNK